MKINNFMKKNILVLCSFLFFFTFFLGEEAEAATAKIHGRFQAGIVNEKEYKEYIFITGKPILLKGKGKTSATQKFNSVTLQDETGTIKLTRNITYNPTAEQKQDGQQAVYKADVVRGTETITTPDKTYKLTTYELHRTGITDSKPGVDYFTGNWVEKKTYTVTGKPPKGSKVKAPTATVTVESYGNNVGYSHNWGGTETHKITNTISFDGDVVIGEDIYEEKWSGTYDIDLSFNKTKDMTYYANEPTQISFAGGYVLTEKDEETYQYSSNLPTFDRKGKLDSNSRRVESNGSMKLGTTPLQKRLPVPPLRDLKGHWAEADLMKLASLEALPIKGSYIGPALNMTRGEFAWAIAQLLDIAPAKAAASTPARRPNNRQPNNSVTLETDFFADVPGDHPYYGVIKAISEKGIITGTGANKFSPNEPLTRAQALKIIIKALGFEGLAPMYNNGTGFLDDHQIPYWAKDAIYVGQEIGLVSGKNGYCLPNEKMSRAEAAAFLSRFIKYLQKDMLYEYRERLLYY